MNYVKFVREKNRRGSRRIIVTDKIIYGACQKNYWVTKLNRITMLNELLHEWLEKFFIISQFLNFARRSIKFPFNPQNIQSWQLHTYDKYYINFDPY